MEMISALADVVETRTIASSADPRETSTLASDEGTGTVVEKIVSEFEL
jgi:hypothetical protein